MPITLASLDEESEFLGETPGGSGGSGGEGTAPDPTPNTPTGYDHEANPVFHPLFGPSSYTYSPDTSLFGDAYTAISGTFERNNRRDYTYGDRAALVFEEGGRLDAGRIDGSDRAYMNNHPGTGWQGYPGQENSIIFGGWLKKNLEADPAVFPADQGPHLHTFDAAQSSYWNDTTMRLADQDADDLVIPRSSIVDIFDNLTNAFDFPGMIQGYWPTFTDEVAGNTRNASWYVGRPRNVAYINQPTWEGDVIDMPQGLRMATFKTNYFANGGKWRFVAAFPNWWNGTDLWLPNSAHLVHGDDPGSGQQGGTTHPFPLPMVHLFVDLDRSSSLSEPIQSAQITDANPAATYYGERRDYWNFNNVYVAPHAELHVVWDPIFSNAVTWMVNNRFGLGRIGQDS